MFMNDFLPDEEELEKVYPSGYYYELFLQRHPGYLAEQRYYHEQAYNIYDCLHRKRYGRLKRHRTWEEDTCRLGFGMLMRQALEVMTADLTILNGIEPGESVYERLRALHEKRVPGYTAAKHKSFNDAGSV